MNFLILKCQSTRLDNEPFGSEFVAMALSESSIADLEHYHKLATNVRAAIGPCFCDIRIFARKITPIDRWDAAFQKLVEDPGVELDDDTDITTITEAEFLTLGESNFRLDGASIDCEDQHFQFSFGENHGDSNEFVTASVPWADFANYSFDSLANHGEEPSS